MTDTTITAPRPSAPKWQRIAWLLLPIGLLVAALAWIAASDPLKSFNNGAPPVIFHK